MGLSEKGEVVAWPCFQCGVRIGSIALEGPRRSSTDAKGTHNSAGDPVFMLYDDEGLNSGEARVDEE